MSVFPSNIGSKSGLEIWRIEKLNPIAVKPELHGKFHSGDCYIILSTVEKAKGVYNYNVHFWLGNDSSQDEQGAAAYRTVELDDQLNGKPVQYRETEQHESNLFLSYFTTTGIQYLTGGIESGFRHVDRDSYESRLFHLKGKRNVRVNQVELSAKSLNQGDVFLLDCGMTIYQWNGAEANKYEKFKGLEIATKIKDAERGGKAKLVFLDSGVNDQKESGFWTALKGSPADVKSSTDGGSDDQVKQAPISLHRISDSTGSMLITPIATGTLQKSMLDSNDAFIVDSGTVVYIWIGKGASKEEKNKSMLFGNEYLTQNNRPTWTPLVSVKERTEAPAFKSLFANWDKEPMPGEEKVYVKPETKLLTEALYKRQQAAETKMAETNGKLEIWRIENLTPVPVDSSQFGQFYSGDSYIVLFNYRQGRDLHITYFWQGRDSSLDERAASAMLAIDIDSKAPGEPTQVRVVQGKEPSHFLALFKGKFIVHPGGVDSGFHNQSSSWSANNDGNSNSNAGPRLYQIKGTSALNTSAVYVDPVASSLNSGDSFVLINGNQAFNWLGSLSNQDERQFAASISKVLAGDRSVITIEESSESDEFWSILGGKSDYAQIKSTDSTDSLIEPRLFICNGVTGNFILEEIFNYSQADLQQDSVVILDCYSEVYIWIGSEARSTDQSNAIKVASDYINNAPDNRSKDTPVFQITAGSEPPLFTSHFQGWSNSKATDFKDPYKEKLKSIQNNSNTADESKSASAVPKVALKSTGNSNNIKPAVVPVNTATASSAAASNNSGNYSDAASNKFPYSVLSTSLPTGVDPRNKELYLSDEEFNSIIKLDKSEYLKYPQWKKNDIKQKHKLF